ncbi:hypothetical protein OF83DRAFT_1085806 [Amylostereum chailletii]|nr:hypothetical protein OF83DRAFT_1085806 [Amylostereum chailletii]
MTSFPWTEPIRLRFTTLDPTHTSLVDAGPPSPSLRFRSVHSSRPGSSSSSGVFAGNGGPTPPLSPPSSLPPTHTPSLAHTPVPSTWSSPSDRPPASPPPAYVVASRAGPTGQGWMSRRGQTWILRDGQPVEEPVATIEWRPLREPRVVLGAWARGRARVERESVMQWIGGGWRRRRKRRVFVQDTRGRRFVWHEDADDEDGVRGEGEGGGRGRRGVLAGEYALKVSVASLPLTYVDASARRARRQDLALLVFMPREDEPEPEPVGGRVGGEGEGSDGGRLRLDQAVLTMWVREHDEARVQELRDLCVVSAVFILAQRREMLVAAPPPAPPSRRSRLPTTGVGDARLETLSQLAGVAAFPSPLL